MRFSLLALFTLSMMACHSHEGTTVDGSGERQVASSTPSSVLQPVGSTSLPPGSPVSDGGACQTNRDCPNGAGCLFEESGCQKPGHCAVGLKIPHRCNVNIAMCSCRDRRTFYGAHGCAGSAPEPWELYPCPCSSDTDCGGGQRCVAITYSHGPHAPGATKECRDPEK